MNNTIRLVSSSPAKTSRRPASARYLFRARLSRHLALVLCLSSAVLLALPCAASPGEWEYTGSLVNARSGHTATLLPSGKVLVAGGYNGVELSSAELYDPATGSWSSTGSLATARYWHTATLLPSGKVLVAGGYNGVELSSAELYDPATGSWSSTGSLATARSGHTATLLLSGKVLVAGGATDRGQIFNFAEGKLPPSKSFD